eukprot:SM000184S03780  [mRNA]  locus=s184:191261:192227:- [translate_table: standard]
MQRKDWLSLVAVHSDAWLLAVAFYYGARFDKAERKRLFGMINELPTVFDVVTGKKAAAPKKESNSTPAANNSKAKSGGKVRDGKASTKPTKEEDDAEDEDEEHGDTFCGICGGPYGANEFWIGCDACEKWYHGKCVKITPVKAEHIKHYKCPSCAKKART